jgi:Zn finger protein HypA/HybF involved in hydrogenase expression
MTINEKMPHVVIALARCRRLKDIFGIRFEEKHSGTWNMTWAFKIKEEKAKKEGYDHDVIKGSFFLDNTYPGCPHCGAKNIFICESCGKVVCLSGEISKVTCSWCGNIGILQTAEQLKIRIGKDR